MITILRKNQATTTSVRFRSWLNDVESVARREGYSTPKELLHGEDATLLKLYNRGMTADAALAEFLAG